MRSLHLHLQGIIIKYRKQVVVTSVFREVAPVGIQNPSNACYMNALLQSLFHTYKFRNALGSVMDFNEKPVTTGLCRLFLSLQAKEEPDPRKLMMSINWQTFDDGPWDMQRDSDECLTVLRQHLEDENKNVSGFINNAIMYKPNALKTGGHILERY
ncbi:hypothetical protein BCR43DRAFT_106778 [Syncephalastrum racemosum]|uniref:ubiquitinyl hydrolase 1 n=1 Tax=Syncephalastrum racemosum TaxID=13706 RepID=A0A1X2H1T1_SYNRA|nr:hypothetical protein BCR43DRAFT_106778 [Syncephalastrum racemosum]